MTAYFDQVHDEFRDAEKLDIGVLGQRLDVIEGRLVFDCTVCAQFDGFPEDLRERIHRTVLAHGIVTLPLSAPQPGFDTLEEVFAYLHNLCWEMHSIFHDVAQRGLVGFSDDPRMPLRILYARGEEAREEMLKEASRCLHTEP